MLSSFSFWIWGTIIAQLLTAIFHSISFFAKEKPRNETEKQLMELVKNYKIDLGGGIKRSFGQLFIGVSTCFTFIYIFGAVLNWYFLKSGISSDIWKGFILIELIIYRYCIFPPIEVHVLTTYHRYRISIPVFSRHLFSLSMALNIQKNFSILNFIEKNDLSNLYTRASPVFFY